MVALAVMRSQLLLVAAAGWLATCIQAYAPIQWLKFPGRGLVIMPEGMTGRSQNLVAPQKLTVHDPPGSMSPKAIPYFTVKSDETIAWEDMGWCMEASGVNNGDLVRINHCTGAPSQKWNWIVNDHGRNKIQLKDSQKCIEVSDEEGALNGAEIKLQDCAEQASAAWRFSPVFPAPASSRSSVFSTGMRMRHVVISVIALAGVAALSFSSRFWRSRAGFAAVVKSHSGGRMPLCVDQEMPLQLEKVLPAEGVALQQIADGPRPLRPTARWRTTEPVAVEGLVVETSAPPISADDLTVDWNIGSPSQSVNQAAHVLEKQGCCCIRGVLDPAVIDALRETVMQRYNDSKAAITKKGKKMTDQFQYAEILHVSQNRYNSVFSTKLKETCLAKGLVGGTEPLLPYLFGGQAPLLLLVEKMLGRDARPFRLGSVISEPDAVAQVPHFDGPHLFPDHHAPAHVICCFLPLIDVLMEHGPPDFWPGSHINGANGKKEAWSYADMTIPKVQFPTRVGDAIIFDCRIVHRGTENNTQDTRPMFYHDFSRAWVDNSAFLGLPEEKLGLDDKPDAKKGKTLGFGGGGKKTKKKR